MSVPTPPITREEIFLNAILESVQPPYAITRIEMYLAKIAGADVEIPEPITRIEKYLAKIAGESVTIPVPKTRIEMYLAKIAGEDIEVPVPITRVEMYLAQWAAGAGYEEYTVTGVSPLLLAAAVNKPLVSLTQYGLCSQASTPTPSDPVDIVCNNGSLKMVDDELPAGYKRVLGFAMNNNSYWEIEDFPLYGSDTLRFAFEASDACNVIGAYSGSASGNNYSLYVGSSSNYLRYKNGAYNSGISYNTRYDVEITPTGTSGMKTDSTWTEQTFTTPTNLCIGTTATSASSAKLKGNLHGNIEVVGRAKLVPCERVSDNALGYYDLIGEVFYEQASGYSGAVSLGYDGSHYSLAVVGTPESISVTASGADTQTATAPNIFAVGDYADEVNIISGGVKRKVGIKILTGEETGWALSDSGTTHRFRSVKPSDCYTPASRAPSVCTHFKYVSTGSAVGGMFIGASQYWYFIPTDQTIDTADEWTAWLKAQYAQGTPIIVLYPLKEETTESVMAQALGTAEGDNVVSVTAEVSPIQLEATYAKQKGA